MCSLNTHPIGYNINWQHAAISLLGGFSALPLSIRHWQVSNTCTSWGPFLAHRTIAVLEAIPVFGLLVALIEKVIVYIHTFFKFNLDSDQAQKSYFDSSVNDSTLELDALWDLLQEKTKEVVFQEKVPFFEYRELAHRFKNILSPKATIMKYGDTPLCANQVTDKFIAAQAPLAQEVELFWGMVWTNECTIVDLTNANDRKHPSEETRVDPYYPLDDQNPYLSPDFCVSLVSTETSSFADEAGNILELKTYTYGILRNGKTTNVNRLHFDTWPDHGEIDCQTLDYLVNQLKDLPKCVVHCRAGVGRTGSLITAAILKDKIENGEINEANLNQKLLDLIITLRIQRGPKFVQKDSQFSMLKNYALHLLQQKSLV